MQRQLLNIALAAASVFAAASVQAADFPAAVGEFSAADAQTTVSAPALTRAQVREETAAVRSQLQTGNSEISVQPENVQSAKTRADVREEGRLAIRSGKIAAGELSM